MLASLLYPYDDDAAKLMDLWLSELETQKCLVRYEVDSHAYIQISNWAEHQKIDKPSKSKFPAVEESPISPANVREDSSGDQGPKEGIRGEEGKGSEEPPAKPAAKTKAPPISAKPPKPTPIAPGANGEFLAANWLSEELGIAFSNSDRALVAQVITFEARIRGDTQAASEWLLKEARAAMARGDLVNVFWFKDRKFAATEQKDIYQRYLEGKD